MHCIIEGSWQNTKMTSSNVASIYKFSFNSRTNFYNSKNIMLKKFNRPLLKHTIYEGSWDLLIGL